ncbi:MAG: hypothetical protein PH343_07050 [Nitrospira sp.]|nr:hypothetical protein [Nitrospira sp.]
MNCGNETNEKNEKTTWRDNKNFLYSKKMDRFFEWTGYCTSNDNDINGSDATMGREFHVGVIVTEAAGVVIIFYSLFHNYWA